MNRFALLASGLALSLSACNESSPAVTTAPEKSTVTTPEVVVTLPATKVDTNALNGTTVNAAASKAAVASATQTTQDAFQAVFDSTSTDVTNPMGSQKVALQNANTQMRAAFQADPNNTQACFGLAVTSLAVRVQSMGETMGKLQDEGLTVANPTSAGRAQTALPGLARAMSNPTNAPSIEALQDSVEKRLFPTLDSAIYLLQKAWKDPAFTFKIADPDRAGDSLVIDRGDVGFALAGLKGVRGYLSWLLSYSAEVRMNNSYAWIDTLGNIDGEAPTTPAQIAAFDHVKTLIAPTSGFLKVRSGKEELLGSVVSQFREALSLAKEAATMSYELKRNADDRALPTITTASSRDKVIKAADTALSWLSGPRTVTLLQRTRCKEEYRSSSSYVTKRYDAATGTYRDTTIVYNNSGTYTFTRNNLFGISFEDGCGDDYTYSSPYSTYVSTSTYTELSSSTVTTRFNLSALIQLKDLKVFLPDSYAWNSYSTWKADGPFSLTKDGVTKTANSFDDPIDSLGATALKGWLHWADPSFGGTFPDFATSEAVIDLVVRLEGKTPSSAARVGTAFSLLR
ncbi:MAG: hypothetical protein RL318_1871 [Fibrobacterota bacterium]|jgi:hypothetical protein